MSETKTLHFSIGENFGLRLMEIAHEHFRYNYDIKKAFSVFDTSFVGGCPVNLQKALLTGDMVITVDEESQEMVVCTRESHHDEIFPKINFDEYFKRHVRELNRHAISLCGTVDKLKSNFRYKNKYDFSFSVETIVKFIYGDDSDIMYELETNEDLKEMTLVVRVAKDFVEKANKIFQLASAVNYHYKTKIDIDLRHILALNRKIGEFASIGSYHGDSVGEDNALDNYLEASKEINETLKKKMEPVSIMDNYDAGWLAPNGDYYALNGEMANMLHNTIAEALFEDGLIPKESERNPDVWLEENGWVKIHHNWILFDGSNNKRKGKPNTFMTTKQIKAIRDYINGCYACVMKVGFKQTRLTPTLFTMEERTDKRKFYEDYFTY